MNNDSPSTYCYVANNKFYCVPVHSLEANVLKHINTNDYADFTPDKLYLNNKNLLYSLNNPSGDDVSTRSTSPLPRSQSRSRSPSPNRDTSSSEIAAKALYFPKLIIDVTEDKEFNEMRSLLCKVFPTWTDPQKISFEKLTGGITNMLLQASYEEKDDSRVLIRLYGHGTNLIIDRHREFILHLNLNSLDLAPAIHSRFKNGVVYGFLPGRSLEASELSNPNLYPLIAQRLGDWHENIDYKLIETGVETLRLYLVHLKKRQSLSRPGGSHNHKQKFISSIYELIEDWINIVPINPNLIKSFSEHLPKEDVSQHNLKDIIREEFLWLKRILQNSKSPIVSSHCDLLSGNIIIPEDYDLKATLNELPSVSENPIKFIDYEYMLPAPRAFDIANHLAEWQGFACDRLAIPEPSHDNPVLVNWCKGYLNGASLEEVHDLIDEIVIFYGMPGFYWGIWAMIQNEISNIDFNYADYGELRLQEYWDWKESYVALTNPAAEVAVDVVPLDSRALEAETA